MFTFKVDDSIAIEPWICLQHLALQKKNSSVPKYRNSPVFGSFAEIFDNQIPSEYQASIQVVSKMA